MIKIEKIPTIEELNNLLKEQELKLDDNYIKYLKDIVNLEYSALRNDIISNEERIRLSDLTIYRKACIYNIYLRAMEIINKEKEETDIRIINNINNYPGICVKGITENNKKFNLYNFNYSEIISTIDLFEYQFSCSQRGKESNAIIDELEYLYNIDNPYKYLKDSNKGNIWEYERNKKIKELEYHFRVLADRVIMPDEELYKAEVQNRFAKLFEKEYGVYPKRDYIDESKTTFSENRKNHLIKNLKCEYPSLTLKKEVKYY